MKLSALALKYLNVLARIVGLVFTIIGIFFVLQRIYYIVQPTTAEIRDTLGFPQSFRPLVIAAVSLVIGVHFLRGKAYQPDHNVKTQLGQANSGRAQSWWTGEYLNSKTNHENDS